LLFYYLQYYFYNNRKRFMRKSIFFSYITRKYIFGETYIVRELWQGKSYDVMRVLSSSVLRAYLIPIILLLLYICNINNNYIFIWISYIVFQTSKYNNNNNIVIYLPLVLRAGVDQNGQTAATLTRRPTGRVFKVNDSHSPPPLHKIVFITQSYF